MHLILIITARCNAACTHCTTSCSPTRTEALTRNEMTRLIDEAAGIDDGQKLRIDITGGEPFLDFALLVEIVEHAARLGAVVSCVTNAYWAHSDESARARLSTLRAAGLSWLAVSVSRFHQRYVPLRRARRALETARALGFKTEIKAAVTRPDLEPGAILTQWKAQLDADFISVFPVIPNLRDGATLPESEFCRDPGLPEHRCPGSIVCVEPNGAAVSCAGPSFSTPFITLGDVRQLPLAEINRRFRTRNKQRILREIGPIFFARGAIAAGLGSRLREAYAGPCDLCQHIGTDPDLYKFAEGMTASFNPQSCGDVALSD